VPRHTWAVIQFTADNPGFWTFHCHVTDHAARGQQIVLNVLGEEQAPLPDTVRTCPATDCVVYPEAGDPAFSNVTPQTDVVLAVLLALALVALTVLAVHNIRVRKNLRATLLAADAVNANGARKMKEYQDYNTM